jgi:uncharacterized metal-binding protein
MAILQLQEALGGLPLTLRVTAVAVVVELQNLAIPQWQAIKVPAVAVEVAVAVAVGLQVAQEIAEVMEPTATQEQLVTQEPEER